jgi:acyl-[acyl-carrier-protein]-phospholipid O-acyltransferase/long-chain-fatty-acid--[acyl-carrier-protein] ligase
LFGPSKYGILPEMLRDSDLPAANGIIQMTTFLSIIFGTAAAGYAKHWFGDRLWVVSVGCVAIAAAGTAASLLIRRTPIAHPGLEFTPSSLGINRETRQLLRHDRPLLGVLLISSLFWFVGGVTLPAVNAFGRLQLGLGDDRTSLLAAMLGVGIAGGCLLGGQLSHKRINFQLVTAGSWGIVAALGALSALGLVQTEPLVPAGTTAAGFVDLTHIEWPARLLMIALGVFAGVFVVPLQVFLQSRPPEDQKGRMIGAMNLINWIGILLASGFYFLSSDVLDSLDMPVSWTFALLALAMLPVAVFYRPDDVSNASSPTM